MILIEFYDNYHHKTLQAAVSNYDAAYTICQGLDNNSHVSSWRLVDHGYNHVPWYKQELWTNLENDISKWRYE